MLTPHNSNGEARRHEIYVSHQVFKDICECLWKVKPFVICSLAVMSESTTDVVFGVERPIGPVRRPPAVKPVLLREGIHKCCRYLHGAVWVPDNLWHLRYFKSWRWRLSESSTFRMISTRVSWSDVKKSNTNRMVCTCVQVLCVCMCVLCVCVHVWSLGTFCVVCVYHGVCCVCVCVTLSSLSLLSVMCFTTNTLSVTMSVLLFFSLTATPSNFVGQLPEACRLLTRNVDYNFIPSLLLSRPPHRNHYFLRLFTS